MGMRGRKKRECSLCGHVVDQKETRHAMSGKFVYYNNYALEIGDPEMRRRFFYCPDCTTSHAEWMLARQEMRSDD